MDMIFKMKLYLIIITLFFLNFDALAGKSIRILIFSSRKNISFEGNFDIQAASKKINDIENYKYDPFTTVTTPESIGEPTDFVGSTPPELQWSESV